MRGVPRAILIAIGAVLFATACAPGPGGSPSPRPRDQYLIEAAELESVSLPNLYDAVRQLRPGWFSRGTRTSGDQSVYVYYDDQQLGDGTALRRFTVGSVERIRFLAPTEAQVRYGQINRGRSAILLQSSDRR